MHLLHFYPKLANIFKWDKRIFRARIGQGSGVPRKSHTQIGLQGNDKTSGTIMFKTLKT